MQFLGRHAHPKDVLDFLCDSLLAELSPDPHQRTRVLATASGSMMLFLQMVEDIMSLKKELKKVRQRVEVAA